MKFVNCENHFEGWEEMFGAPPTFVEIIFHFCRETFDDRVIFGRHGQWIARKEARSMTFDEWEQCYYCGKPCWRRQWARMEVLSGHFDGVHRQFHVRCERKVKEAV